MLILSPAMQATFAAHPVTLPGVTLPGVTGAPRLAARVRFARGTVPPPTPPTAATLAALDLVRETIACGECEHAMVDAYSCIGAGGSPMSVTR